MTFGEKYFFPVFMAMFPKMLLPTSFCEFFECSLKFFLLVLQKLFQGPYVYLVTC